MASWDWQDNGQSFGSTAQPYACFAGSGTHQIHLTVTSSDGCTASSAVPALVQVYPNPIAAFGITPQQVSNAVPEVTITNSSQLGTQYMYFLPDGTIQTEPSFSYSNSDTGTHCIQLILSTDYGCVDSATACYRVAPEYSLYIPNAFTPNGDGLNDMFQIKGVGISDFEMSVFDRWGVLLFQSTDPLKGWTGHHLDTYQPVMQGVYVFKVDVKDIWNKYHSVVGRVHLIR
jgi:gliding motility-associated-like protein